jgi:hypothetical protein
MKKKDNIIIFLLILILLVTIPSYCNEKPQGGAAVQVEGWSSVDYVFFKQEQDILTKKPGTGPIKIGFTVREVREVMGVPDRIDEEEHIFYYHHSPIYFGADWKVKSWDNRYGNLNVIPEVEAVRPGSHTWKVFQQKGFPIRVKKEGSSHLLEYVDQYIYVNEEWLVEAIQNKKTTEYEMNRTGMSLEDFLKEYREFLKG